MPITRTARVSRPSPRSCQTTMAAANNSITESRPNPTKAMDEAMTPAVMATPASAVIHAMLAYSSQNPRRRSRASSLVGMVTRRPWVGHNATASPVATAVPRRVPSVAGSSGSARVQRVDDVCVLGVDDPALELQGGGEFLAFRRPLGGQQLPVFDLLNTGEPPVRRGDSLSCGLDYGGVCGEFGERACLDAARPRPRRCNLAVQCEQRDHVRPPVTEGERLADQRVLSEQALNGGRGYVLSPSRDDQLLLPVHHAEEMIFVQRADIARVGPAVLADQRGRVLRLPKVARRDDRAASEYLPVVRDLDLHPGQRPPHGTELERLQRVRRHRSGGLCHAIHVKDLYAETSEESADLDGQRSGRAQRDARLAEAEQRPDRAEHLGIGAFEGLGHPWRRLTAKLAALHVGSSRLHRVLEGRLLGLVLISGHERENAGLHLFPHPWHTEEEGWLHGLERAKQLLCICAEVDMPDFVNRQVNRQYSLGDVGQGEIGNRAERVGNRVGT